MAREQDTLNRSSYGSSSTTSTTGSATVVPPGASSDEIRQNIDRTRAEMDQTVDALGNRLQPRHLLDEVLEYFNGPGKSSGAGSAQSLRDGATSVLDRVKDHPMPAVLIGAGLAWMLFEGDKSSRTRVARWDRGGRQGDIGEWRDLPEHSGSVVDARTGLPYDESTYGSGYGANPGSSGGVSNSSSVEASGGPGLTAQAREKLAAAGSAIGGAASSVRSGIGSAASTAASYASGAAGSAGGYARSARDLGQGYGSRAYGATGRGLSSAQTGVVNAMEEYPLISGVAALAIGAVAGLLLPATRRETELMGEYSGQLREQATQAGQQLYAQGKAVATAATSAVTDAADESGIKPGSLADKARTIAKDVGNAVAQSAGTLVEDVKRVAQDASGAATESAKREGLQPAQLKETAKDIANRATQAAKDEAKRQQGSGS